MSDALFGLLPDDPAPLPLIDAMLPTALPIFPTVQRIDEPACRRLERRGLVRVHRWKSDSVAIGLRFFAGRLP